MRVIMLKSELKSFSWNDGLFAVYKQKGNELYLWKIVDGKLERHDDGEPNITITGAGNKGIFETDLIVKEKSERE